MYDNNNNANQRIYYPNDVQSPTNQQLFYSNSIEKHISDLERYYTILNERIDDRYNDLNNQTLDLHSNYTNLVDQLQKTTGELSQHKNKHDNLKKRIINKLNRHEMMISEELQSFITIQENVNKTAVEQLDQQEKIVSKKLRLVMDQQESLEKQVVRRLNQHEMDVLKELQLVIDQQEAVNNRALEQLDEHEKIIYQELQPYFRNVQIVLHNPMANLLKNLPPRTVIEQITVQGAEIKIRSFVSYNSVTNTSTFLLENNEILSINTNQIDSLTFG